MNFDKLNAVSKNIKFNEPMKNHTTFRIGGNADVFVSPKSIDELARVISVCKSENYPCLVVGNGSNMLVSDKGIRGVVIHIGKDLSDCRIDGDTVYAQSGILMSALSAKLLEHSLSGFERLSGIPGTLGGGIFMNAGAYGGELSEFIKSVEYLDTTGEIKSADADKLCFGYRTSIFQKEGWIILSATMQFKKGNADDIKKEISEYRNRRNEKQPIELPSAGSVFKRPEGHFAGKLIQDANLMGYTIGGAQVSTKHAGFIVNTGNATAQDVLDLIEHIKKTVLDKFGVELEPEIRLIGER